MKHASIERGRLSARQVRPLSITMADVAESGALDALSVLGINLSQDIVNQMVDRLGIATMDSADTIQQPLGTLTTGSLSTPIQFLQNWLPGFVRVITAARKIDELIGISTIGDWDDEEIVQGVLEPTGLAVPYGDYTNVPLSSWNINFERRTVVRFEMGMLVGVLEQLRTARMRVDTAGEKRTSSALALDIQRNRVGFFGYNDGNNRTYGFLNDPALPAALTATGAWSASTFLQITAMIRTAMAALRVQSQDTIDPKKTPLVMALPTNTVDFLTVVTDFGMSVQAWLDSAYPNVRVVSAPELNNAVGGVNVMYIYAESVDDGASDDNRVWIQVVPSKFQALGVEKRSKSYLEDYANASAGVMLKRPYAVVRMTGV